MATYEPNISGNAAYQTDPFVQLPDTVLEFIFRHSVRSECDKPVTPSRKYVPSDEVEDRDELSSVKPLLILSHVNKRFRKIVFDGTLWSSLEVLELTDSKTRLSEDIAISILRRLDLSKVDFARSCPFSFEDDRRNDVLKMIGPYIQCLCLDRDVSPLELCRSVRRLRLSVEHLPFHCLVTSLPLQSLVAVFPAPMDPVELVDSIASSWPNLAKLTLFCLKVSLPSTPKTGPLLGLTSLKTLDLSNTRLSHSWLTFPSTLVTLLLSYCRIPNDNKVVLANLAFLETVEIINCVAANPGDESTMQFAIQISHCTVLRNVHLDSTKDAADLYVEECPSLLSLFVRSYFAFNWGQCFGKTVIKNCPSLEYLHLDCCLNLKDTISLNHIKELLLTSPLVTIEGYLHLPPPVVHEPVVSLHFPLLEKLVWQMERCPHTLSLDCPSLEAFTVKSYPWIEIEVPELQLQVLNLSACSKLESLSIDPICIKKVPLKWAFELLENCPLLRKDKNSLVSLGDIMVSSDRGVFLSDTGPL